MIMKSESFTKGNAKYVQNLHHHAIFCQNRTYDWSDIYYLHGIGWLILQQYKHCQATLWDRNYVR